jgi:hypothetical protein
LSERIKEQIKFGTEVLWLLTVLLLTTVGGTLSLILRGVMYAREVVLATGGILLATALMVAAYSQYKQIRQLINKL